MTESFEAFSHRVFSFDALSPSDKIIHAAWYLHAVRSKEYVGTADINECFKTIHLAPPQTSVYLKRLAEKKPPILLKSRHGYKLEGKIRRQLADRYDQPVQKIAVSALLIDLLAKVENPAESVFLAETLKCYSVSAFRAAIVMAWNLTYDHILTYILQSQDRISKFNISVSIKYPKKPDRISDHDSFFDFKEFEVVEVLVHSKIVSKNVGEILKEKLKRRNAAAHPSLVSITQAQADDVITDLVNNVIVKLS